MTLTGTLTTDTPTADTPLPTKVVTFTIGSGSTAQSCSGHTDTNGDVSAPSPSVDQPDERRPSPRASPATTTTPRPSTTTPADGHRTDHRSWSTPLPATMPTPPPCRACSPTRSPTRHPQRAGHAHAQRHETCTATTDATGTASCPVTPGETGWHLPADGSFGGDATLPLQLTSSTGRRTSSSPWRRRALLHGRHDRAKRAAAHVSRAC